MGRADATHFVALHALVSLFYHFFFSSNYSDQLRPVCSSESTQSFVMTALS